MTTYRALDWSFDLDVDGRAVSRMLERVLVDLETAGEAEHRYRLRIPGRTRKGSLHVDDEELLSSNDEQLLYATLLWHVNQGAVSASTSDVLLHASCAATSDGRAVVMAAPMESGKTTLVAGLVRSGLGYLTDETVALHPTELSVRGYPKPLSIDDGSWGVLADLSPPADPSTQHLIARQWQVPASGIRPDAVITRARPALIVLPRYEAGAGTELAPMAPADALIQLWQSTFAPERSPGRDFAALAALCRKVPAHRLVHGDLSQAVTAVRQLLGA